MKSRLAINLKNDVARAKALAKQAVSSGVAAAILAVSRHDFHTPPILYIVRGSQQNQISQARISRFLRLTAIRFSYLPRVAQSKQTKTRRGTVCHIVTGHVTALPPPSCSRSRASLAQTSAELQLPMRQCIISKHTIVAS